MNFDTLDTEEKAQQLRMDRLKKINNGEVWGPLSEGPYLVWHWLPISEKTLFSPDDLKSMDFSKFVENRKIGSIEVIPNPCSVRIYSDQKDETREDKNSNDEKLNIRRFWNVQVFYSGALEMTCALSFSENESDQKRVSLGCIFMKSNETMNGFKECMSSFNITVPIIMGISLLRAQDYRFSVIHPRTGDPDPGFLSSKKQITLERKIENLQGMRIEEIERPILDALWRILGYDRCDYYTEDGSRITPEKY